MSDFEGIIYPPPEIRGIVDSTAKYVAKNGTEFENKIKRDHQGKPKFSFLFVGDPFNAYYRSRVKEIREQKQNPQSQIPERPIEKPKDEEHQRQRSPEDTQHHERDAESTQDNDRIGNEESKHQDIPTQDDNQNSDRSSQLPNRHDEQEQSVKSKLDEYIQEKTVKLVEPPPLNFLATPSTPLTDMEIDVIKLTSQYIATYGRAFLLELVSREQANSDFDFTKPQHGQFSYMNQLFHQYTLIRNFPPSIIEELRNDATSQKHVLDKIRMRAEWNRMLQLKKRMQEEAEEKEKQLYSQIDWQDFVVVETIDYGPEEVGEYPPTTADQVGTRMLLQQRYEEQHQTEEMEIDMDMDSDDEGQGSVEG